MTGVMMVDVGTALLAILPLLAIRVPRPTRSDDLGQSSVWAETAAGFRYLVRRRGHRTLIAMATLINALLMPLFSLLLPLLVLQRLNGGAAQLGWLSSALGVGLIVGGVALGAWGGFRKRIVTTLTAMAALGVAVIAVGLTPASSFLWALVSMSCVGLIVPIVNGPVYAILQATIAPDYQGRVFSLVTSLATAAAPLGRHGRPGGRDRGRRRLVSGGRNCLRGDGNRGLLRARSDGNRGRYRRRGRLGAPARLFSFNSLCLSRDGLEVDNCEPSATGLDVTSRFLLTSSGSLILEPSFGWPARVAFLNPLFSTPRLIFHLSASLDMLPKGV